MSVCTRKDGTVFVQWSENGKKKRKYFGKGLGAEVKARAYNDIVTSHAPRHTSSPIFKDLVNEYLKAKSPAMPAASAENIWYKMSGVILPILGGIETMGMDHGTFDKYVANRAVSVKMTTIHRELSDVRAILNWSVKRKLISNSPMTGYEMPRRDDETILPLAHEEIETIIEHSADHLRRAMLLSYFCGLRPGAVELLSIRYSQVNWSVMSITIISAKKGGLQRREVPIHPALPIREWYEADGENNGGYVITWKGKPIKSLKTAFASAKRRAGVGGRKIPLYSLRHAFVTALLHQGVDLRTVADISGHDVGTMLKHYAHSMDAARKDAIHKLPSLHPWVQENEENGSSENVKK
ncbi:MAG: site-specific integrase [Proteobacteria bacterium]|nr:site-specific integrase [Pseudomonadota bacterium]